MGTRKLYSIRLQYARWEELPSEIQAWFAGLMGSQKERGQAFYELYFYWYNIAHELGHVLRAHYGTSAIESGPWDEEIAVNNFAVAYWQARNERERLLRLGGWVREALETLEDPLPPGEERSTYFNTHYSELGTNPSAYGHYQFSMVLAALRQPIDLHHHQPPLRPARNRQDCREGDQPLWG